MGDYIEVIFAGGLTTFLAGCLFAGFFTASSCSKRSDAEACFAQTKDERCWSYILKDGVK